MQFSRQSEKLVKMWNLTETMGFGNQDARRMLDLPGNNPFDFDGDFEIRERHLEALKPYLPEPIDFEQFVCFIGNFGVYE